MLLRQDSAVQYVRMSTDMQRYSIENQSEAIALYAAQRGLTILRSYEDAGKSGLTIAGRVGLQRLILDVQSERPDFGIILVYDISRWGRFQDSDESAHYEYVCRKAGVAVEYCAEQFENDGSLSTTVLKNIKRAMAGEFSRELSVKVFAGKQRIATMGFRVGATAGYGLRRVLVDEQGNRKAMLSYGQRKNVQSERVILAPGPPHEIKTIHRIYDMLIDERRDPRDIAQKLNIDGIPSEFGRAWTGLAVRGVLSKEKYIGNAVYNQTSKKFNANWRRNPKEEWIRKVGAFEAVVSKERFEQAGRRLEEVARRSTKNEMLDQLTALWCKSGHLSTLIVERALNVPKPSTYARHFGSMAKAFRLVGFRNRENIARNADARKKIIKAITEQVTMRGGTVERPTLNKQLIINGELKIGIFVSRLKLTGPRVWQFGYVSATKPDILIGARIRDRGGIVVDYFILPFLFLPHGSWITTSETSAMRLERFRATSLEPFFALCERKPLGLPTW